MKEKKQPKFKYKYKKYDYDLVFCPHCMSKMDRKSGVCTRCGFRESSLDGATNALAKKAKQNFREDEVVKVKKLPPDVSYKKLLLLALFTGFVGGHLYYVGRYKKAIFYSVCFALFIISFYLFIKEIYIENALLSMIMLFVRLISAVYVVDWFFEMGRVIFRRFKVPVLAPEKIVNYDRNNIEIKEEK